MPPVYFAFCKPKYLLPEIKKGESKIILCSLLFYATKLKQKDLINDPTIPNPFRIHQSYPEHIQSPSQTDDWLHPFYLLMRQTSLS